MVYELSRVATWRCFGVLALCGVAALAGCANTVTVTAGPDAVDPRCATVLRALDGVDELGVDRSGAANIAGGIAQRREVSGQSAAAWGDPPVVMRCGVPRRPPTDTCLSVNGTDWVGPADPTTNDRRYVTYGTTPAVEVFVAVGSTVPIDVALAEVSDALGSLPVDRACS